MTTHEINVEVAEKLFGYDGKTVPSDWKWFFNGKAAIPHFAGNLDHAMYVIQRMRGLGYAVRIESCSTDHWDVSFNEKWFEIDDVLPRAICMAALKAWDANG